MGRKFEWKKRWNEKKSIRQKRRPKRERVELEGKYGRKNKRV